MRDRRLLSERGRASPRWATSWASSRWRSRCRSARDPGSPSRGCSSRCGRRRSSSAGRRGCSPTASRAAGCCATSRSAQAAIAAVLALDLRRPRGDARPDGAARRRRRAGAAGRVRARAGRGRPGGVAAANGRIEAARYLGFTLGPVLGGLLAAAGGTRIALLVNAASFLAVALAAQALRARREPRRRRDRAVRARPRRHRLPRCDDGVLAPVVVAAFVSLLFMTASATAEVFFAKDVLHAGDTGYGVLMTLWTMGMVVGSTLVASRVPAAAYATARAGGDGAAGRRPGAADAVARAPVRPRRLPGGRRRPRHEERRRAHAHPRARPRRAARPRVGRLQRRAQRRGADRPRRRRPARRGHRRALDAAGRRRAADAGAAVAALARAQAARRRAWAAGEPTSDASPSTTTRSRPARLAS